MTDDFIQRRLNWIDGDQQHQGEESDILGQQRPVVILGEPGMGKTELLNRLGDDPNAHTMIEPIMSRLAWVWLSTLRGFDLKAMAESRPGFWWPA